MADMHAARVLGSAIATLEEAIVPAITEDAAKIALDLVIRALSILKTQFSDKEKALGDLLQKDFSLLKDLALEDVLPGGASSVTGGLPALERQQAIVETALASVIPDWVAIASREGPVGERAREAIKSVVESRRNYLECLDPDIAKGLGIIYRGGRIDRDESAIDAPKIVSDSSMTAYLRAKFPQTPSIRATDVRVVPGGFSKQTVLFTKTEAGKQPENWVMRKDLPEPFLNRSIEREFKLVQRLHAASVRVAEPLWFEPDTLHFEGNFLVSKRVQGNANVTQWRSYPDAVARVARDFGELLAQVHTMDAALLGYPEVDDGLSAGDALLAEIGYWEQQYAVWRKHPNPLIDIPLAWLKQHVPSFLFSRPARVVHGDAGFHNLMVHEGRITALLDWEFAHLGDPNEDLAFTRLFLDQLGAWEPFIERYRACGGDEISTQCEDFYKVYVSVRNSICANDATRRFDELPPDKAELRFLISGVLANYLQVDSSVLVLKYLEH